MDVDVSIGGTEKLSLLSMMLSGTIQLHRSTLRRRRAGMHLVGHLIVRLYVSYIFLCFNLRSNNPIKPSPRYRTGDNLIVCEGQASLLLQCVISQRPSGWRARMFIEVPLRVVLLLKLAIHQSTIKRWRHRRLAGTRATVVLSAKHALHPWPFADAIEQQSLSWASPALFEAV